MNEIEVRTPDEVRRRRASVEKKIASCQEVITAFVEWRRRTGDDFQQRAAEALAAVQQRDRLLIEIEREALWAYDYESAHDYYESKGFSRQRWSQIKYEVVWKELVGNLDELLPAPNGHHSRHLGTTPPAIALPAYRRAVQESGGKLPSESKTKELLAAAKEGVPMHDDNAVIQWRDRQHLKEIEHHYKALKTDEAREEAREITK